MRGALSLEPSLTLGPSGSDVRFLADCSAMVSPERGSRPFAAAGLGVARFEFPRHTGLTVHAAVGFRPRVGEHSELRLELRHREMRGERSWLQRTELAIGFLIGF
ncbi:MAG: hypothetical protein NW201_08600 [Gemmatimonadales bacterium]|nr:hypothetical protein [Gemmatimonadales bacterium]